MPEVAAAKPVQRARASIECLACPADEIASGDTTVDAVFCRQGLQFFSDREATAKEIHRVVRPGG